MYNKRLNYYSCTVQIICCEISDLESFCVFTYFFVNGYGVCEDRESG